MSEAQWDVFISHASEDKAVVIELAEKLRAVGVTVWEGTRLSLGDNLTREIDRGLAHSRFGVVVLSDAFFSKEWPRTELDALLSRQIGGEKTILPVLHNLSHDALKSLSPLTASSIAVSTAAGIPRVAQAIIEVVAPASPSSSQQSHASAPRLSISEWREVQYFSGVAAITIRNLLDEVHRFPISLHRYRRRSVEDHLSASRQTSNRRLSPHSAALYQVRRR